MKEIRVTAEDANQKCIKFLHKYFKETSEGFLFKMLRKKNITLNGKKADGKETVAAGDVFSVYFSDETFEKLRGSVQLQNTVVSDGNKAFETIGPLPILFENEHVLLVNKPAGILTQKAKPMDLSLNEWLIGYLLETKQTDVSRLRLFHPSVCNRLDRNTSGLVLCGKTLLGSQKMSELLKNRTMQKFYRCFVEGHMTESAHILGYLHKDERLNKVTVTKEQTADSAPIETFYQPIQYVPGENVTLVEVELITGKTHQIRAHLASIGFPLVGDLKYGNQNRCMERKKRNHIQYQMLHAYRVEFPELEEALQDLSQQKIIADLPQSFSVFLKD